MARSWIIDSRGLAKKVINASLPNEHQLKDCGAQQQCPNCHCLIDNSDVSNEWPGLPAGVKFEPSDVELLDHLASKRGDGNSEPHAFLDEFIPTLEGEEGICCTHPKNLPGAKKDGSSVHFFYRIIKAFASGRRKRCRIEDQESLIKGHVRWHKTGKTKPVMDNGVQKGFKKIMVLYASSKKGAKPDKCHWILHQYHLGTDEEEKDGEYVVSKIFYQPQKETDKNEPSLAMEESKTAQVVPRTPKTCTPDPPRPEKTPCSDCLSDDYLLQSPVQDAEYPKEPSHASCGSRLEEETENGSCLAGNCEVVGSSRAGTLMCNEVGSDAASGDIRPEVPSSTQVGCNISSVDQRDCNACCGIDDLDNLELDTPPDFDLADLQFASQDSVFDWLDRA